MTEKVLFDRFGGMVFQKLNEKIDLRGSSVLEVKYDADRCLRQYRTNEVVR